MDTIDNVFILHSLITHYVNEKKKLFSAFIDFKRAFDFVVRDILWYKLIQMGVRGKILNIIQSMYKILNQRSSLIIFSVMNFTVFLELDEGNVYLPFLCT